MRGGWSEVDWVIQAVATGVDIGRSEGRWNSDGTVER